MNDIDMITKQSGLLHQPDSTIDISGDLNAYEQKAYLACLKIARKALEESYGHEYFEVKATEFYNLLELGGSSINTKNLSEALSKINNLIVKYNISGKTGGHHIKRYGEFSLISGFDVETFKNKKTITFSLPHQIKLNMTGQIKQARINEGKKEVITPQEMKYLGTFTTREIQKAMSYKTTGGLKLDGWIDKWGESKFIPPIKIDDLKMLLGAEDKYIGRFRDFQLKCLDVAVREFNEKSGKNLRYRPYRTGERITGIENPRGHVVDIQFRYKRKAKNKVPMIGEISNVYGLIELFPKQAQKYKTLPRILEKSINSYGVEFTRKQCEHVVANSTKGYINFLKEMITDENYDDFLVWKEEEEAKNKPKKVVKEEIIDKIQSDNEKEKARFDKFMELSEKVKLAATEEERHKLMYEIFMLNNPSIDSGEEKNEKDKRNEACHDINRVVKPSDLEEREYTEKEIISAMKKCVEDGNINMKELKELRKRSLKGFMLSIKKYL